MTLFPTMLRTTLTLAGLLLAPAGDLLARDLLAGAVDESAPRAMAGHVRHEVNAANDQGPVADNFAMDHMILQLSRSPEQSAALQTYLSGLSDPSSPHYHQWLTASQFGAQFGVSTADLQKVTAWLTSYGFTINQILPSGMAIDFSGSALSVRQAFHTEIHALNVGGVAHVANVSPPTIPATLAPAVTGIVSLHDFRPHTHGRVHAAYTVKNGSQAEHLVTPGDLATIYNFVPLFNAGLSGQGQTITLIEDSDLYSTKDWTNFRNMLGLSGYSGGNLQVIHPAAVNGLSCRNPGVASSSGDDLEATIDAEWASAAAPSATIQLASCASTRTTFGGFIALQNLLNSANPPAIISISFGECEAANGAAANAAIAGLYQQAAALGVSVFVSAGDSGAAGCDAGSNGATHGIGVSAYAATPYNVAVGGTDFGDVVAGKTSQYWSATNGANYASALSYIPEIPWNDSCAGQLLASYFGYAKTYGTNGFCASATAQSKNLVTIAAASGGPSGCANGTPVASGVVGGSCVGTSKPSWQAGGTTPNDGVRDIPDVSLFAADGVWGHYYVVCYSNPKNSGASCSGAPSSWAGGGGTSFAAPIMAGLQAIINQKVGTRQGNPNPVYYRLAAQAGNDCNSANAGASCIFHNITSGDIDVDCSGSVDCYGATVGLGFGQFFFNPLAALTPSYNGALSVSSQSFSPAFGTGSFWNFATGLGSVNAYNLVTSWSK